MGYLVYNQSGLAALVFVSISQGKFHFYKKQVMNKSSSVIFRLVRLIILGYNRLKKHMKKCKIIDCSCVQFVVMRTRYSVG